MFASYHLAFLAVNSALQERIVPKEEIATFFQQYKKLIKEVNPAFIFNMDESFVSPNTKEKVVVYRTTRGVTKEEKVPCHLTLVGCVCADNTAMKPLIILDIKTAPPAFLTYDLLSKAFISGSETGWINGEIYSSWVKDCFLPFLHEKREHLRMPMAPAILLLDGHSTRFNKDVLEQLVANRVKVAIIPAHSSHLMQPLDLCPFGEFKKKVSKLSFSPGDGIRQKREKLVNQAILGWRYASMEDIIEAGFKRSGLWPFNPNAVLMGSPASIVDKTDAPEQMKRTRRISINNRVITCIQDINDLFSEAPPAKKRNT